MSCSSGIFTVFRAFLFLPDDLVAPSLQQDLLCISVSVPFVDVASRSLRRTVAGSSWLVPKYRLRHCTRTIALGRGFVFHLPHGQPCGLRRIRSNPLGFSRRCLLVFAVPLMLVMPLSGPRFFGGIALVMVELCSHTFSPHLGQPYPSRIFAFEVASSFWW